MPCRFSVPCHLDREQHSRLAVADNGAPALATAADDRHVDPSELSDLQGYLESLRHHCDMHNEERLIRKGG